MLEQCPVRAHPHTTDQTRRRRRCHITADLRVYSVSTGLLQLTVSRPTVTTHLRRTITLQRVQNAAARLVLNLNLRDHVTPALKQLHWLPVEHRIKYKLCTLMHRIHTGRAKAKQICVMGVGMWLYAQLLQTKN